MTRSGKQKEKERKGRLLVFRPQIDRRSSAMQSTPSLIEKESRSIPILTDRQQATHEKLPSAPTPDTLQEKRSS